jgi:hypothetical protein
VFLSYNKLTQNNCRKQLSSWETDGQLVKNFAASHNRTRSFIISSWIWRIWSHPVSLAFTFNIIPSNLRSSNGFFLLFLRIMFYMNFSCRSQWPRGQTHEPSSPAQTLGLWVRVQLDAWICVRLFCVCVVLCVGMGLSTGWSQVEGILPTAHRIKELKQWQSSKNCTAIERERIRRISHFPILATNPTQFVFLRFIAPTTPDRV